LSDDEPIIEHANGGQGLLDRRLSVGAIISFVGHDLAGFIGKQCLDEGRNVKGLHVLEVQSPAVAPIKEVKHPAMVGSSGVRVADVVGEVGDEPLGRILAHGEDDRGHVIHSLCGDQLAGWPANGRLGLG